ncbi:N-acetylglucosaminyl deacetylase, LmbE family [Pricia antarctica]|uniref:N-acetylglucosaminyl deacetylase, LmbE family n=1 Tax=Pricia antarctica TaxID=641691 RepID=A0A1G7FD53_9FLAO|nr:PIG-L family deacetylase [Pricia antarctica]SDE73830.1 N-acetylglucosaminyl deacetylase, LmbE family [Pricia antarctica]
MRHFLVCMIGIFFLSNTAFAQKPHQPSSSEIYHSLQKLNFLGTALYVAAHPDDENTRLISYLSNGMHARTGYLSLTRGDGGQNLIGPELRELLGVLRTEELLAARRIDGGEQFFSRANDFGYSKNPEETLEIWNKEAVLGDVVWAIRHFKPDVIIDRFDHRSPGTTHGHHTSSAMLSVEAFDLANDKTAYPEQLKLTDTWQPQRLFFNTSWWFYGSEEKFEKADKSNMLNLDVGNYYPVLGTSNNEIAALASSQHLSQGFGRLSERGVQDEYLELLKGDLPKDKTNIFDGIDTSWSRIEGGEAIGTILNALEKNFDFENPTKHLPQLLEAYVLLQNIQDDHWKKVKSKALKSLIADVTGLYLEASSESAATNPGGKVKVTIEAINRSNTDMVLKSIQISSSDAALNPNIPLKNNTKQNFELTLNVPSDTEYTSPYWLKEKGSLGMYKVLDQQLIGKPETPRAFTAAFEIDFNGTTINFEKPVIYHYAKPEKGELYQPFEVLPKATASFSDKVLIFADGKPKQVPVTIEAHADNIKGEIQLIHGEGWSVDTDTKTFEIAKKGDKRTVFFTLSPPAEENENYISPILKIDGKETTKELVTIAYDHIPKQSVLLPSEAKTVRINIKKAGEQIGYIVGAGDEVPESLRQIGYSVRTISPSAISAGSLKSYDAVVIGIRAYNVVDELQFKQHFLMDYVKNGGTLIVQYNTAGRWKEQFENIAPYPLTLSHDRVTDENSEVDIVAKDSPLINFPNTITPADFEGWVQERGLYFPNEWAKEFTPVLSMKDDGESAKEGSLLIAKYGKGHYIYTGLSFFRELPAGVPGAYKLFANMLSVGKDSSQ